MTFEAHSRPLKTTWFTRLRNRQLKTVLIQQSFPDVII